MPLVLTFYGIGLGLLAAFKAKTINMCSGLPQLGVKMSSGYIGVGFLNQLLGCQPLATRGKKHLLRRKNSQGKWVIFFPEEIDT